MLSVAIDIDGVLCDSFSLYKQIAKEEGVTGDFQSEYNGLWKVYTKDNEVFGNVLFDKYSHRIIEDVEPIEGALEGYEKFVTNDRILSYIVTARDVKHRDKTKKWLKEHGFTHYEDLFFYKDKLMAPTQVAVDDKPSTIESYVENARMAICVDAPYNRGVTVGHRVESLSQAFQILMPYL